MPAIFELVEGKGLPSVGAELVEYGPTVEDLSLAVAIVLIGTYVAGLVFSLKTHRDLFNPPTRAPRRSTSAVRLDGAPLGRSRCSRSPASRSA